jgi:Xaa-Pro aminopeptidase
MQVDREERFDFARLRSYRLGRARAALEASDLGALLVFDMNNVRYLTSPHIGEWARDKLITFALLKPGVCVNEIVALATKALYELGSDDVEAINAFSGERCSPHPHNFSDRLIRPGDQAFFDIIQAYNGYRTCYYRTFNVGRATPEQRDAYARAREWMDAAIQMVKPGVSTDQIARLWPRAEEFGFDDEMEAFGLQFGHGLGLGLHERPIISRLNSLEHPAEIKEGMVFALETYCPASDGFSAARIEEEVVVTADVAQVITLYPAEELPVANNY